MKQYYKIGEISKLYQIGPDSLRYYEELGILTPKRAANGYRMYSLHDLWRLNVIRDLRQLDFSMEQIGNYMRSRSVDSTQKLLKEELSAIKKQITFLEYLKSDVTERLMNLEEIINEPIGIVQEKFFQNRNCHMIHEAYHSDEEMDMLIERLVNTDKRNLYIIGNNRIGSILSLDVGTSDKYPDYKGVFIIDKNGPEYLEEGEYLSVCYHGSAQQHYTYVPMLQNYAKEHGYQLTGPLLEILWVDIHQAENQNEHITELQIKFQR